MRFAKRFISLACLALLVSGLPAAAQEMKRLSSTEIQAQVVQNTITGAGRAGNCTFFDHFAADGSATAKCGSYTDTGRWRAGEDSLCIKWSKRPNEYCLTFFGDGAKYQVVNPDRGPTPFPFTILPGRQG